MAWRVLLVSALIGVGSMIGLQPAPAADPVPVGAAIYVVNRSSVPDVQVEDALAAIQDATSQDFGPIWNAYAQLQLIPSGTPRSQVPAGWVIRLVDHSKGGLGYHNLQNGWPYAEVSTGDPTVAWSLIFTHELWEMLVDPYIDRSSGVIHAHQSPYPYLSTDRFSFVEVADPVEASVFGYTRQSHDGTPVVISDFVTEAWYRDLHNRLPRDFTHHVHKRFEILSHGYAWYYDPKLGWTQGTA